MAPKRFVIPAMNDDEVESDSQSDQEWMEMLCLEHDNHRKAVSAATRALKATEDRMVRQRDRMMRKRLAKKLRSSDVEKSVDKTDGTMATMATMATVVKMVDPRSLALAAVMDRRFKCQSRLDRWISDCSREREFSCCLV